MLQAEGFSAFVSVSIHELQIAGIFNLVLVVVPRNG